MKACLKKSIILKVFFEIIIVVVKNKIVEMSRIWGSSAIYNIACVFIVLNPTTSYERSFCTILRVVVVYHVVWFDGSWNVLLTPMRP